MNQSFEAILESSFFEDQSKAEVGANGIEISADQSKDEVRAKILESSFFEAILESSCHFENPQRFLQATDMDLEQYEGDRKSLELSYGVEIPQDAVQAASDIVKFFDDRNEALKLETIGVAQLLEEAASKLWKDFHSDSGEKDLDRFMFLYDRAFIEYKEIMKEKDLHIYNHPRVKDELDEVKCALEAFRKRWDAPLEDHISVARHEHLETLCKGTSALLSKVETRGDLDPDAKEFQDLDGALSALMHTLDTSFMRRRIVTSRIVAEVASLITGVPRIFLLPSFNLPLDLLVQRLSRRIVGADKQIRTIISAMSIEKPRFTYSFLLLGPRGQGKTALAEALAKELFGDKIFRCDVASLTREEFLEKVHSVSHDAGTRLISNLVILFKNIDKADADVHNIIHQVLRGGSYVGDNGERIDFLNVLILFTSAILDGCNCLRSVWESSNPPFKGFLESGQALKAPDCNCNLKERLTKVERWCGFYDLLDDLIALPPLSARQHMSVFRTQIRNAASCENKVVFYSSAAVFRCAWNAYGFKILEEGGHPLKHFAEYLISNLCDVENDSVVYIDLLIGSKKVSFRTKKLSDTTCKDFKDALRNSKIFYQIEKEQTERIYDLSIAYFRLRELIKSKDESNSVVLSGLRGILDVVKVLLSHYYQREQIQVGERGKKSMPGVGAHTVHERGKRVKYMHDAEFSTMRNKLVEQDPHVQVLAKALLKSINSAYHGSCTDKPRQGATSFLVLGLRSLGKSLVDSLSKYFVADDGSKMLFEVDLSASTNINSLFSCTSRNEPDLLLKDVILRRPFCVLVFYNLELARKTVFADIISILDDGLLFDNDGTGLDFSKLLIIFVSKLGNKSIIHKIVGGGPVEVDLCRTTDKDSVGFRFEILNRVDEIWFFNPFASDQLLHGARLPMKEGKHLVVNAPGITEVLLDLFEVNRGKRNCEGTKVSPRKNPVSRWQAWWQEYERICAFLLRKGLVKFDGSGLSVERFTSLG